MTILPIWRTAPTTEMAAIAPIEPVRPGRYKLAMASYQYVYVMKGLNKTFPGGKQVLKDIWLSFLPGAKIGVLGLNLSLIHI